MCTQLILWASVVISTCNSFSVDIGAKQGWFGLYHPWNGTVWPGQGIPPDQSVYNTFKFGVAAIYNMPTYGGFSFEYDVKFHCYTANVNAIYGILAPPSEGGVVNNPNDTNIWHPTKPPGLIQSAHRWSVISTLCPQVFGIIIDDFFWNYPKKISLQDVKDIHGALIGKDVDPETGKVDHTSAAKTPQLQFFPVFYKKQFPFSHPEILSYMDGVSYWIFDDNPTLAEDVKSIQKWIGPDKQIISGNYIANSRHTHGFPAGNIANLTEESRVLYQEGSLQHLLFFAGLFFVEKGLSKTVWESLGLVKLMEQQFAHLGESKVSIVDSVSHAALESVDVWVYFEAMGNKQVRATHRVSGKTGEVSFGGIKGTYSVFLRKAGYSNVTVPLINPTTLTVRMKKSTN